jgi:hypothetical protein
VVYVSNTNANAGYVHQNVPQRGAYADQNGNSVYAVDVKPSANVGYDGGNAGYRTAVNERDDYVNDGRYGKYARDEDVDEGVCCDVCVCVCVCMCGGMMLWIKILCWDVCVCVCM